MVFAKPPFGGPEQVLKYLARYTHRVAISNQRLLSADDRTVSFHWKDYADDNSAKVMTLDGVEFLRRFLQHVLPSGFVRIRHFGFLANACRASKLTKIRVALDAPNPIRLPEAAEDCERYAALTGHRVDLYPGLWGLEVRVVFSHRGRYPKTPSGLFSQASSPALSNTS